MNQFGKNLIWFINRACILYLTVFFLSQWVIDSKKFDIVVLNNSWMSIDYLHKFSEGQAPFHQYAFSKYREYYQRALKVYPKYFQAYGLAGFCSYYLGEIEEAEEFYQKAVLLNPRFFWFPYNLGVIYFQQGDFSNAEKYLITAVNADQRFTLEILEGSNVFLFRDRAMAGFDRFEELTQQRIRMKLAHYIESLLTALKMLIVIREQAADYPGMLEIAESLYSAHLNDPFVVFYTAKANYLNGNIEQAILKFHQSLKLDPENKTVYLYLAQIYNNLGQSQLEARFLKVAEQVPKERDFLYELQQVKPRIF